jgi:AcrR family transcriptional regulator
MGGVARKSGLSRRTVYNQFEDRDALCRTSRHELLEAFEQDLPREIGREIELRTGLEQFFIKALSALASTEHRELRESVLRDGHVAPWLEQLYQSRVVRPLMLAVEHFLLTRQLFGDEGQGRPHERAVQCLDMLMATVSGDDKDTVFSPHELVGVFVSRLTEAHRLEQAGGHPRI